MDMPMQWVHKSDKSKGKREPRAIRRQPGLEPDHHPVIIAFGDPDLKPSVKSLAPVPVKVRQELAKKALVLCVNENKTSKICSNCDSTTTEFRDPNDDEDTIPWGSPTSTLMLK
ncbi:uncharacterized protein BYT42DRAFT_618358 [Radiomyces spectabilis]|uniref:uncharacterized protein n=1 Tax=Radiomyces spectabilis TaxID=64574 RepID=UPI00221F7108|nr:uncharacterized protein BYT42DRAFT_618358 [Radiomyces spectabilis]KAI8365905.1 hypothetical protein BYT42DRAFT_618358 [Radiomyces spectabilis]